MANFISKIVKIFTKYKNTDEKTLDFENSLSFEMTLSMLKYR